VAPSAESLTRIAKVKEMPIDRGYPGSLKRASRCFRVIDDETEMPSVIRAPHRFWGLIMP
jgi:hypothetical protein